MLMRCFLALSFLGLVTLPAPARVAADDGPQGEPTLVVRVRSIDGLLGDAKYLVNLVGKSTDVQNLDREVNKVLSAGIEGIDRTKPIGLYVYVDENFLDSIGAVMIPVKDEKAILSFIEKTTKQTPAKEDGLYVLRLDNVPGPIYFKFANGYAYFCPRSPAALQKVMEPGKVFGTGRTDTASVTLRIDQIPLALKQAAIGQLDVQAMNFGEKKSGESAAEAAVKEQVTKEIAKRLAGLIRDGAAFTTRFNVNQESGDIAIETNLAGKPGSDLATHISQMGTGQSLFGSLLKPSVAASLLFRASLPENIKSVLGPLVDDHLRKGLEKEQDPQKRALAEKLAKALAPTLKAGELDVGLALSGPTEAKHYNMVLGVKVKQGETIEKTIKEIASQVPEAGNFLKLDAESAGAHKVHRLDVPLDADAVKLFGNTPIYAAFRDDAVLFAAGDGGLDALKKAVAASAQTAAPLRANVALGRVAPLMKDTKKDAVQAAAQAFGGESSGKDSVSLTIEGGKAFQVRLSVKAPVLKFLQLVGN